ncbi:MAG: histone deacetylase, partial [Firmicutes bacterium]|nr:histone deacetylase [Bacillota bacterium]
IESEAVSGRGHYSVYCISIPIRGCPRCRDEARDRYEKLCQTRESFDYIFLQDRTVDLYRQFDCHRKKEETI